MYFKTIMIVGLLAGLTACSSHPERPATRSGSQAGSGDSSFSNSNPMGNPAGSMSTDGYTALVCEEATTHRGVRAWRRLSNIEVQNTVRDVFAAPSGVDYSSFVNDISKSAVFDTSMASTNFVTDNRLSGYFTFAESLAAKVNVKTLFPCIASGKTCIATTVKTLGAAAWRRPLLDAEITALSGLYDKLIADGYSSEDGARFIIQALVLSQGFLYRSELGEKLADGTYELTDWELASALSYAILRTVPDAELKTLATAKKLRDSSTLAKQAERLLATAAAKTAWKDFAAQWLQTGDILDASTTNAALTDDVKLKLKAETENFFVDTMFSGAQKTFSNLLLADNVPGDQSTSFIYGGTVASGKITFKEPQRRGLLGQGNFLARTAAGSTPNPIKRGVFVLSRLMCSGFAPAPATTFPEVVAGLSTKELLASHSKGSCASCHKFIDDFGIALDNFDAIGKFRETDGGDAIAINGTVRIDGKDVAITSAVELSEALSKSNQALECFARQTYRYALGRIEYASVPIVGGVQAEDKTTESMLDKCTIQAMTTSMTAKGGDLKTALIELVSNPGFRLRLAGPR